LIPGRLVWRFFLPSAALLVLTTLVTAWVVGERLTALRNADQQKGLRAKAQLLSALALPSLRGPVDPTLQVRIRRLGAADVARLTVVRTDHVVIADSDREDVSTILPHGSEREELQEASTQPFGMARRMSETTRRLTDYVAVRVEEDGKLLGFARAARPVVDAETDAAEVRAVVLGAVAAAVGISLLGALLLARRLAHPLRALTEATAAIAAGDYTRRVRARGAEELVRLAESFNRMADELRDRLQTIHAEQRELKAILGGMVEGVLAVDGEERVVLMNEAGGRILNLVPAEVAGKPLWEVVRLREVTETLAAAVREGAPRVSEIRRPDRPRDRVLRLHASPLVDPEGHPSGAVLVFHDITELRQLEQVRRDFVANASHELKTPLAAIRGLVETILDDEAMEPATERRFLGSIRAQTGRLGDLVEEMLALSRLEAEGAAFLRVPLDLRDPVREALQALLPQGRERRLEVVDETGTTPVIVLGSSEPLRRVAANLIDNALKYTPAGGTVRVRVRADGERGLLEVVDSGPGIALSERERIFERFYRLDKGRGRDSGGTGLGLAIVKHLVAGLRGQIAVGDAPGGGSLFRVAFPLADRP
jgi:two-component system, OmpR family, phosphate regulon sensor histidine kinase PhoR